MPRPAGRVPSRAGHRRRRALTPESLDSNSACSREHLTGLVGDRRRRTGPDASASLSRARSPRGTDRSVLTLTGRGASVGGCASQTDSAASSTPPRPTKSSRPCSRSSPHGLITEVDASRDSRAIGSSRPRCCCGRVTD